MPATESKSTWVRRYNKPDEQFAQAIDEAISDGARDREVLTVAITPVWHGDAGTSGAIVTVVYRTR